MSGITVTELDAEVVADDHVMIRMVTDPAAPPSRRFPVPGVMREDHDGNQVNRVMQFEKGKPAQRVPPSLAVLMLGDGPCAKYRTGVDANKRMTWSPLFVDVGNEPDPSATPTVEGLQAELAGLQEQMQTLLGKFAAAGETPADPEVDDVADDEDPPSGLAAGEKIDHTLMAGVVETTPDGCLVCPECREYTTAHPPSPDYPAQKYLDMHRNRKHKSGE